MNNFYRKKTFWQKHKFKVLMAIAAVVIAVAGGGYVSAYKDACEANGYALDVIDDTLICVRLNTQTNQVEYVPASIMRHHYKLQQSQPKQG